MHKQAQDNCKKFVNEYLGELIGLKANILDVGSLNLNGSLKGIFTDKKWNYTGIDIVKGKGVSVVLSDPYSYPFSDQHFDVVVSSSCFEHNEMFWLSFKEIVRVTKNGGFIYLSAPFKDGIHRTPVDCWRFLPDGYRALTKWCPESKLLDSYVDIRPGRDCIGIFKVTK